MAVTLFLVGAAGAATPPGRVEASTNVAEGGRHKQRRAETRPDTRPSRRPVAGVLYRFYTERMWDRAMPPQPTRRDEELPESSFRPASGFRAVAFDGPSVTIGHDPGLRGQLVEERDGVHRYELARVATFLPAGGRFVVRWGPDRVDAELVTYQDFGMPITSSERGRLDRAR